VAVVSAAAHILAKLLIRLTRRASAAMAKE
jgi:hypothetical protein